jgi:hypothetical protein
LVAADIAALRAAYARLGFMVSTATPVMQPDPGGSGEIPLGLLMAHIALQSTGIELIAVRHPGQGSSLDKWLAKREGLHAMGLRTSDIVWAYRELTAAGLVLPPIRTAMRRISGNGVKAVVQSRSFELPESIAREGSTYVIQYDAPDVMFDPRLTSHANGAVGIRSVFAVVENMDEAFGRYQRLPGTKRRSFAVGRTIVLNQQQFVVVERSGFNAMFPGLDVPPPPHLGGFAVAVTDIGATRSLFATTGISFKNWGDQGIWVSPEDTGGTVVAFVDQSSSP